jgi:lysophospholipase
MEADPMRAVFLDEFDAMAEYVSPPKGIAADPSARVEDVTEETPSVA